MPHRGRIVISASEFLALLNEYEVIQDMAGKKDPLLIYYGVRIHKMHVWKTVQSTNELGSKLSQVMVFFRVEWLFLTKEAQQLINDPF